MDTELLEVIRFLRHKSSITIKDLEHSLKISRRQAIYRLDKINSLLAMEKAPQMIYGNSSGSMIILDADVQQGLRQVRDKLSGTSQYYFSRQERKQYLYFLLFLHLPNLPLSSMLEKVQVSRSTLMADLKELQQDLAEEGIYISNTRSRGYYLEGAELNKRRWMMRTVCSILAEEKNTKVLDQFLQDNNLQEYAASRSWINELALKHHIRFVEDRTLEFIYIYTILLARILNGRSAVEELENAMSRVLMDESDMQGFKEYAFVCDALDSQGILDRVEEAEICYLTSWILGISFGDIYEETSDCEMISRLTGDIMTRFEQLSGARYANLEHIFIHLYAHLRPAYYRMLFGLPILNPLKDKVRREYPDLYKLVEGSVEPLQQLVPAKISEDEITYLVIHFASIYAGSRQKEKPQRRRAAIICPNGAGSSAILASELQTMFSELDFYPPFQSLPNETILADLDLIFSTCYLTRLPQLNIPVISVSSVMDQSERYHVMKEVFQQTGCSYSNQPNPQAVMDLVEQYAENVDAKPLYNALVSYFASLELPVRPAGELSLCDLMKPEYIQLQKTAGSWQEALELSYLPLLNAGMITRGYIEDTIRSVEYMGPYIVITPHLALAHTRPEKGAVGFALGLTVLKDPVEFHAGDNDPVKYIFSLSALDNITHIRAMASLLQLLEDPGFFTLMDTCIDPEDLYEYIVQKEAQSGF